MIGPRMRGFQKKIVSAAGRACCPRKRGRQALPALAVLQENGFVRVSAQASTVLFLRCSPKRASLSFLWEPSGLNWARSCRQHGADDCFCVQHEGLGLGDQLVGISPPFPLTAADRRKTASDS